MHRASKLEKIVLSGASKLRRIQRAPDKTKKRYLIFFCSICMVFVIGSWLIYLNSSLPQLAVVQDEKSNESASAGTSFWATFARGLNEITAGFGAELSTAKAAIAKSLTDLKSELTKTNEYSFVPETSNFSLPASDPVPKTRINLAK